MKTTNEKRAWRFTALDLIILVVLLAVIAAAVWFFGPFRDGSSGDSTLVNIEYTVEVKGMEEEYLGNIRVGDTVIDSVTKKEIGTITAVETMPLVEYVLNTEDGIMMEKEYPGQSTLLVTISSPATFDERGYSIEGYRVAIGVLHYMQLPNFVGSGYCIGIEAAN
ncbi:MAG: DUF4330 family protein [Clostridia bacterium]|nr:DUF4330 family protein [Clostridia bacterium]